MENEEVRLRTLARRLVTIYNACKYSSSKLLRKVTRSKQSSHNNSCNEIVEFDSSVEYYRRNYTVNVCSCSCSKLLIADCEISDERHINIKQNSKDNPRYYRCSMKQPGTSFLPGRGKIQRNTTNCINSQRCECCCSVAVQTISATSNKEEQTEPENSDEIEEVLAVQQFHGQIGGNGAFEDEEKEQYCTGDLFNKKPSIKNCKCCCRTHKPNEPCPLAFGKQSFDADEDGDASVIIAPTSATSTRSRGIHETMSSHSQLRQIQPSKKSIASARQTRASFMPDEDDVDSPPMRSKSSMHPGMSDPASRTSRRTARESYQSEPRESIASEAGEPSYTSRRTRESYQSGRGSIGSEPGEPSYTSGRARESYQSGRGSIGSEPGEPSYTSRRTRESITSEQREPTSYTSRRTARDSYKSEGSREPERGEPTSFTSRRTARDSEEYETGPSRKSCQSAKSQRSERLSTKFSSQMSVNQPPPDEDEDEDEDSYSPQPSTGTRRSTVCGAAEPGDDEDICPAVSYTNRPSGSFSANSEEMKSICLDKNDHCVCKTRADYVDGKSPCTTCDRKSVVAMQSGGAPCKRATIATTTSMTSCAPSTGGTRSCDSFSSARSASRASCAPSAGRASYAPSAGRASYAPSVGRASCAPSGGRVSMAGSQRTRASVGTTGSCPASEAPRMSCAPSQGTASLFAPGPGVKVSCAPSQISGSRRGSCGPSNATRASCGAEEYPVNARPSYLGQTSIYLEGGKFLGNARYSLNHQDHAIRCEGDFSTRASQGGARELACGDQFYGLKQETQAEIKALLTKIDRTLTDEADIHFKNVHSIIDSLIRQSGEIEELRIIVKSVVAARKAMTCEEIQKRIKKTDRAMEERINRDLKDPNLRMQEGEQFVCCKCDPDEQKKKKKKKGSKPYQKGFCEKWMECCCPCCIKDESAKDADACSCRPLQEREKGERR